MNHAALRPVRLAWLLLTPLLLLLGAVAVFPLSRTLWLSGFDASLLRFPFRQTWVGLGNFVDILQDPLWWRTVFNTILFTVVSVGLETVLGLSIALCVAGEFRGRWAVRTAMLVPWAVPTVVAAQLWRWLLHDTCGLVNDLLLRLGLLNEPVAWLANRWLAMPAVILVDVWKTTPFMAPLLLAGLQAIPREVYEAARADGATPWQQFTRITLPLLKPALLVALIFRTLDALRAFDVVYVLTGNHPGTMTVAMFARQQLVEFGEVGYGSAASSLIFLVVAMFTAAWLVALRSEEM